MIDEELKASNEELRALHDKLKQSEEDKLRALERERAMSMELQKATDDEVEKLNAIEDMRKQFDEERRSKEMQMQKFNELLQQHKPIKSIRIFRTGINGYYSGRGGIKQKLKLLKSENVTTIKRDGMSIDDQKKIFGWPDIPPTHRTVKTKVNKRRLHQSKICSHNKNKLKQRN